MKMAKNNDHSLDAAEGIFLGVILSSIFWLIIILLITMIGSREAHGKRLHHEKWYQARNAIFILGAVKDPCIAQAGDEDMVPGDLERVVLSGVGPFDGKGQLEPAHEGLHSGV